MFSSPHIAISWQINMSAVFGPIIEPFSTRSKGRWSIAKPRIYRHVSTWPINQLVPLSYSYIVFGREIVDTSKAYFNIFQAVQQSSFERRKTSYILARNSLVTYHQTLTSHNPFKCSCFPSPQIKVALKIWAHRLTSNRWFVQQMLYNLLII